MQNNFLKEVEDIIGYSFANKELLLRAITHASYANEHVGAQDYDRLEFLGDAVLGYVVGLTLYETYPQYQEGKLTKMRANIVDRVTIADAVNKLGLMKYVRVGAGNAGDNVLNSKKANCDIFESIIGAIVIDNNNNLKEAKKFILRNLGEKINSGVDSDFKSKVWEICAKKGQRAEIVTLSEERKGNFVHFTVALNIDGKEVARGKGSNKTNAAQDACKNFLR